MTTTPDGPVDGTELDPANTGPEVDPDTGIEPSRDTEADPATGDPAETAEETDPGPMPGEDPGTV